MARRTLILLVAVVAVSLSAACGGGSSGVTTPSAPSDGGSGSGAGNGTGNGGGNGSAPPSAPPSPLPTATLAEQVVPDTLLGGVAFGSDGNLYASTTTPSGLNIYNPQLQLLPSPTPMPTMPPGAVPFTWPTVPKNLTATGPTASSGTMVNALGTTTTTTTSGVLPFTDFNVGSGPKPTPSSFPALAQYNVSSRSWMPLTSQNFGNFGDRWVSLASPGQGVVFVIANHFSQGRWTGSIVGFGIACVSPTIQFPLGPSAIGPDGNLWVATDPSLNSNAPSDPQTNPEILFDINTSTGEFMQFRLQSKGAHISAIAPGNNSVWFTDDGLNSLGFVPIGGTLMYPIKLPNQGVAQSPDSITKDSIGRMWFTEKNAKRVGYVVPNGTLNPTITIFRQTLTGSPLGIIGCLPNQPCPQNAATNIFFAESKAIGSAASPPTKR
jgi:hypothetical protein